ncbi:hypothetical protein JCGZ_20048 [Jatropha curcas]|uniref:Uncharacterized protein n=1 Tax=Jatropha curcas TaxID=180498 RepID=A0A067LAW4_JATCU|nr:hypothetical protein JCGZ_20048 [Jatropha curcas]
MISKGVKWEDNQLTSSESIVGVARREGRRRDCLDRAKVPSFAVTLALTRNENGEKGRKAGCCGEESTVRRRWFWWSENKRGEAVRSRAVTGARKEKGKERKKRKRKRKERKILGF